MAIFNKKTEEAVEEKKEENTSTVQTPAPVATGKILIAPRLSEKAAAGQQNRKFVFLVDPKANKIEIKKAVEKFYGVQVAGVNTISRGPKTKRYGKFTGKTAQIKKAVITLTPDSKQPDVLSV